LLIINGIEMTPQFFSRTHARAVPRLLLGGDLEPGNEKLPEAVSVILKAGRWQRNSNVFLPESELLKEFPPGKQRLPLSPAKSRMFRRDMFFLLASRLVEKAVVVVGDSITPTHRVPVLGTGWVANTLDEARRGGEAGAARGALHNGAIVHT